MVGRGFVVGRSERLLAVLVLSILALPSPGVGQEGGLPEPGAAMMQRGAPVLVAAEDDEETRAPLEIGRAEVRVVIVGFLARTTTTLSFENEGDQTLEGELVFPLPEGATVSGYGLDVNGELVDAVVVEAQAARVTFETEVRKGVDPGLVEWVRGNSFRTRVWPIPARGRRIVKVEYVSELVPTPDGGALYTLPLRYSRPVPALDLRIEVVKGAVAPAISSGRLANLVFETWEDRLVASAHLEQQALSDDIRVSVPPLAQGSVMVEGFGDGKQFFAIDASPQISAAPADMPGPRRVGLLWDASLSHQQADAQRELAVVKAWLASLGDVEVVLSVFRNVAEPPLSLRVHEGDPSEVLTALAEVAHDGGTSLEAVRGIPGVDYYLLVSDGLTNIGRGLPEKLNAPVFALTASPLADHGVLGHLARSTGGSYLRLGSLGVDEAVARIGRPPGTTLSIVYDRSAVTDVLPEGPVPVDDRVRVTGRLLAPEATVTLRLRNGAGDTAEQSFVLRRARGAGSGLAARFWAERKAAELAVFARRNYQELVALGREFGVVTPGTSLLVLETLDQYLLYGIEPPESSGEFRAEYLRLVADREREEAHTREARLQRVLSMWRRRVDWWGPAPEMAAEPESRDESPADERAMPAAQEPRRADCGSARPTLQGVVEDAAGGVLPGATVTASNEESGAAFQTTSDARGRYALCGIPPGRYRIGVDMAGFKSWERHMRLPTRGVPRLDATLEVGEMTESISVVADSSSAESGAGPAIAIKPWDPDTPYLAAIKEAGHGHAYAVYLRERAAFAESPSFYLDCADYFLRNDQRAIGLRVLTGLLDLKLEEPRLLRVVAHRLQQLGELDLAVELFENVLRLRPEEPQSLRDLAQALSARGDAGRAGKRAAELVSSDYVRALGLLEDLILGDWDSRFPEIEVVALMDANRLLAIMQRERLPGIERVTLDPRLRKLLDLDLRITLTWDTDQTDMDLWLTEPTGEKCDYSHNRTAIGGLISPDFTRGYGPEEYLVRRAVPGNYLIQANFYGSSSQSLLGPTTAQATVFTNFGRVDEAQKTLTLRLDKEEDVVEIGTATFGPTEQHPRD